MVQTMAQKQYNARMRRLEKAVERYVDRFNAVKALGAGGKGLGRAVDRLMRAGYALEAAEAELARYLGGSQE